jgi:hypothetical protein
MKIEIIAVFTIGTPTGYVTVVVPVDTTVTGIIREAASVAELDEDDILTLSINGREYSFDRADEKPLLDMRHGEQFKAELIATGTSV